MAVRGRVDGMQGRDVTGWAVPAARRRPCSIIVTDAAGTLIAKGRASELREDLAALGLGRNNLAFRLALPGGMQRQSFHVFADGVELPGSPLETGPGRYDGDCVVDRGVLKGWVRERIPDLTAPSISVITQHGEIVGQGQSGHDAEAPGLRAAFEIALQNNCFGAGELRLAVLADGVRFTEAACALPLQGSIDLLTPEACSGWLLAPDAPQHPLEIAIFRNDVAVGVAYCSSKRQDVDDLYPGRAAGFAASFPLADELAAAPVRISLRLRGSGIELFEGPYIVGGRQAEIVTAQRAARSALASPDMSAAEKSLIERALQHYIGAARRNTGFAAVRQFDAESHRQAMRLNIVIPVHGDVAATKTCIDSVLAHRIAAIDRVILINDASPEPGMAELLESYVPQPNLFLLTNAGNLGFVKTANRGFAFAGLGDVLLLNADTIVYPGAFEELHAIAQSSADIATVTALSNDATIFSYPGHDLAQAQLSDCDWAQLAEIALAENAGLCVDVPTAHGFCMLIKGVVLRKLGAFDERFGRGYCEENDFCARAADLGYRHVAAAGVFVQHAGSLSFGAEKQALLAENLARLRQTYPEYFPQLREFERQDGLRAARWALDAWRLQQASRNGTQFVLVVSNYLGGGSAKALADIEQAVGYGSAGKLGLNCRQDGRITLSATQPVFRASFAADELDALFRLLDAAQPGHVVVHQLLGFAENFIRRLQHWAAGRHNIYYLHDFYALCPRVTFIDAIGEFCNVAETAICERCLKLGGAHADSRLAGLDAKAHRALFGAMLRGFSQLVAPSPSAGDLFLRGFPDLPINVIPHPESGILPAGQAARRLDHVSPAVRRAEDAEEITLFGALGPHKGSAKLLEIARRASMTHPGLSFRVIGYTSLDAELLALGNVIITGRYTPETLPELAAEARGALALFLHEWPETYSYTLSEALSFGFVPLVPDIGAPAGRVRAMQFGVAYPFPADAAGILRVIEDVLANRLRRFKPGARPEDFHPGAAAIAETRRILNFPAPPAGKPRRARTRAGQPARPRRKTVESYEKHPSE